jgi:hypothetical protein
MRNEEEEITKFANDLKKESKSSKLKIEKDEDSVYTIVSFHNDIVEENIDLFYDHGENYGSDEEEEDDNRFESLYKKLQGFTDKVLAKYPSIKCNNVDAGREGRWSVVVKVVDPEYKPLYWNNRGKYQKEFNELAKELIPKEGKAQTINGELLRSISRIYHDIFNNGRNPYRFRSELEYNVEFLELNGFRLSHNMSDAELDNVVDKVIESVIADRKRK